MTIPFSPRLRSEAALLAGFFLFLLAETAVGDTVFLKNGSLIDGRVTHRTSTSLFLQIGEIGKLEIPLEEISVIEKNKRVGGEVLKSKIDVKGKREIVSEDGSKGASGPRDDGEDSAAPEKEPLSVSEEKPEKIDPKLKARIEGLVTDLERKNRRWRVRAERGLKAIGRPAIPFLLPLSESQLDLTRVATFRLFYQFGDESVVDVSIAALSDVNEYVRDYANKTLIRITGKDFGYRAQATPRRRQLGARKWLKWWAAERSELEKQRTEFARDDSIGG